MDAMFNAAYFALNLCDKMHGCGGANHTPCLQRKILDYFTGLDNTDFCKKTGQSRFVLISLSQNSLASSNLLFDE